MRKDKKGRLGIRFSGFIDAQIVQPLIEVLSSVIITVFIALKVVEIWENEWLR
jgi:hypothetical protein